MNMKSLIAILLITSAVASVVSAQPLTEPGWYTPDWGPASLGGSGGATKFSSPSAAGGTQPLGPLSGDTSGIAEAISLEIESLARGLENDPLRIFNYVHDQIRHVLYFGSKKGAQLTLLERSGNDFDQCALLVALLRSAGLTANYQFGFSYVGYERTNHLDFKHWVGATKANTNWDETVYFAYVLTLSRGF